MTMTDDGRATILDVSAHQAKGLANARRGLEGNFGQWTPPTHNS